MITMLLPSKLLPSIALLLIFSRKLHGLTFNTSGCGVSKGCFRSPDTCTTSENCDFLITYTANSSTVEFELSGNGNWFAVGFSEDTKMRDTDILMCVSADSLSGHYYADSRNRPGRTNPTPAAVTIIEQDFNGGVMRCRVSRQINPGLTNFKDLNSELFLMGAYGPLNSNDEIDQHTVRLPSSNRLSVLQSGPVIGDGSIMATGDPAAGNGSIMATGDQVTGNGSIMTTRDPVTGDGSIVAAKTLQWLKGLLMTLAWMLF